MSARLWKDFNGEPFLINPLKMSTIKRYERRAEAKRIAAIHQRRKAENRKKRVIYNPVLTMFANPRKGDGMGGEEMADRARNAKGRFISKSRAKARATAKRPRRVIRLKRQAVVTINPRRRARRNPPKRRVFTARVKRGTRAVILNPRRRRSYRQNPGVFSGFGSLMSMGTLKTVGLTLGGFLGVPFVEGFVNKQLPASMQGKTATWVVRIASVVGLSWVVGRFVGKEAGAKVAIGGGAYVALQALKEFVPTVVPAALGGTGSYLRAQPLLGAYQRNYMGSAITASTPGRLQPQSRY